MTRMGSGLLIGANDQGERRLMGVRAMGFLVLIYSARCERLGMEFRALVRASTTHWGADSLGGVKAVCEYLLWLRHTGSENRCHTARGLFFGGGVRSGTVRFCRVTLR